ncbi:1-acyl-sn-glycerol-3-phosphate acyltransferase [uncultured Tateyamaria sp.]|uniref:1-acyl-sn-glycerol-3-phosphate acyltransferase n=1 Tax=uncultured Tateyamaria sp. TaxID=455651 RepID=UPI00261A8AA1|nr:1-acyl-sn-glycerol-3-phosphate acyltransferase [uncultured Tateyamaria sp.]
MLRLIDATFGKWVRHTLFILIRSYYALFYNVSCSGKHLLQTDNGTLILATHVSRHDGPLISAILYSTKRIRPTVHYNEYYHWMQWLPMWIGSAIPMSSPKSWPDERRAARKQHTLGVIHRVLDNGNCVLLFPAGLTRRQPQEIIAPGLSGVHDILRSEPDTPVVLLRLDGLGQFQRATYDLFWSFLGRTKGRRHVGVALTPLEGLDPNLPLPAFNARLEELLNTPITHDL